MKLGTSTHVMCLEIVEQRTKLRASEWLGLERALRIIELQTPHHGLVATLPAAQDPIQAGHEHLSGWGTQSFSEQLHQGLITH